MPDPEKSTLSQHVIAEGNNWYYIFDAMASITLGAKHKNTNKINGNGNYVMQIGNGNNNRIEGHKNLVAERGAQNVNKTVGERNQIGQKGIGNSNIPEKPTDDEIIYQENEADSEKAKESAGKNETQNQGNKEKKAKGVDKAKIRLLVGDKLPENFKW
ncbi:hypothetical protein IL306_015256 [Fusarium sp. DS 682]|nr:hypothetical protein IL306_015256 [Fusarium sp. DS 682]